MIVNNFFKKVITCISLITVSTVIYASTPNGVVESKDSVIREVSGVQIEDGRKYQITRNENKENPCDRGMDDYVYESNWYDDTQVYINSKFCEPALWFDNFYASDRIFDEGVAGTYVRWRNDFSYDEENYFKYKPRVRISVELPGFKNRLRLSFEGEGDEDIRDIAPGNGAVTSNILSLQYDLKENTRSKFSVSLSFSPRVRFRYRYTYPIYQDITLRLTQDIQWKDGVNTARTRFDYEQELGNKYLLRLSTEAKFSEKYDGVDWLHALILFQWIDKRSSLAYEASVNGITEPLIKTTDYRVAVRFRKNFHREWLFYEIAPEISWPTTFDEQRLRIVEDRRSKWKLFFRLEVHFGNAYKKRYQDYNKL